MILDILFDRMSPGKAQAAFDPSSPSRKKYTSFLNAYDVDTPSWRQPLRSTAFRRRFTKCRDWEVGSTVVPSTVCSTACPRIFRTTVRNCFHFLKADVQHVLRGGVFDHMRNHASSNSRCGHRARRHAAQEVYPRKKSRTTINFDQKRTDSFSAHVCGALQTCALRLAPAAWIFEVSSRLKPVARSPKFTTSATLNITARKRKSTLTAPHATALQTMTSSQGCRVGVV